MVAIGQDREKKKSPLVSCPSVYEAVHCCEVVSQHLICRNQGAVYFCFWSTTTQEKYTQNVSQNTWHLQRDVLTVSVDYARNKICFTALWGVKRTVEANELPPSVCSVCAERTVALSTLITNRSHQSSITHPYSKWLLAYLILFIFSTCSLFSFSSLQNGLLMEC